MDKELLLDNIGILFSEYGVNKRPISVNFREMFPFLKGNERFSHSIHGYPAKLIPHIPYLFLHNATFINKGEVMLDPFCGSGTSLLEANLVGVNAFGADANPLARIISDVKTTKIDKAKAIRLLETIKTEFSHIIDVNIPEFPNKDYWFPINQQHDLASLFTAINKVCLGKYKRFFNLCFSSCLMKASYCDPRIAVPVKLNPNRYPDGSSKRNAVEGMLGKVEELDIISTFDKISQTNINRIVSLNSIEGLGETKIIAKDARKLTTTLTSGTKLPNESIDMVLTSPPYASAQKYIRSSSLSLYWLNLLEGKTIVDLDNKNIGHENYKKSSIRLETVGITDADEIIARIYKQNSLRGKIVINYLLEMKKALDESVRVLKRGRYMILVIGNNNVCGHQFNTKQYLSEYLNTKGMTLKLELIDDIKSYGLMTKRNKTANIITREWILIFQKD